MAVDAWILGAPLKVLRQEDHPYHETTLATLGRHELGLSRRDTLHGPGCELFLDGQSTFLPGAAAPGRAWFDLCRELGYEPARHWDWDPALILFHQVVPALAADWHEPPMALDAQGLPDGVLSLAGLRQAFAEAVAGLRRDHLSPVGAKVAETFEWLPLRAVVFHDDAQLPLDFEGTGPCGRVSLWLGIHRDRPVVLEGQSPAGPGSRRWATEGLGGGPPAEAFLLAAGLDPEPPKGFDSTLQSALVQICRRMEGPLDAYRRTYPVGISWHHGRRERLLGRTIVDIRPGNPPVLILDDGAEVAMDPDPVPTWEHGGI
ncbi:MAG: hypothetical protein Q8K67_04290 [Geothrix sp.]|nr:hypothetical protein [Geothrix sp.]